MGWNLNDSTISLLPNISFLSWAKWLHSTKMWRTVRIHWQCSVCLQIYVRPKSFKYLISCSLISYKCYNENVLNALLNKTFPCWHSHSHTCIPHTHTLTQTHAHTHTHSHIHAQMLTQTHTHTLNTHMHARKHTLTQTHTLTYSYTYTHIYTLTHACTLTQIHTHWHPLTETHTDTCMHAHAHTGYTSLILSQDISNCCVDYHCQLDK